MQTIYILKADGPRMFIIYIFFWIILRPQVTPLPLVFSSPGWGGVVWWGGSLQGPFDFELKLNYCFAKLKGVKIQIQNSKLNKEYLALCGEKLGNKSDCDWMFMKS